jgi:preprotein translocase subunit SecF
VSATTIDLGVATEAKTGHFSRLYNGQTKIDFVRRRKLWFAISGIVILAGVISLATRGLNYDIEFVGGTSWQVPAHNVTPAQAKNTLASYGLGGATITSLGLSNGQYLQVQAKLGNGQGIISVDKKNQIAAVLAKLTHNSVNAVSIEAVGPSWGSQVTNKAVEALIVFLVMISVYISVFFEWKMALAAIIAVLHDIAVTVGIYSLLYFLVTPDTIVAFLTILGYSLYDTIVVFDRVRDNTKGLGATGKLSFTDVVNLSMNQTLARSINTSLVAIMPILSILVLGAYVLGATTLQYFGLALFVGLTSGAYSSIFIASPIVAMLKEREPRYAQIRLRLEARGAALQLLTPAAVAAGVLDDREERTTQRRQRKGTAQRAAERGPIRPSSAGKAPSTIKPGAGAGSGADGFEATDGASGSAELLPDDTVPRTNSAPRSNGAQRRPANAPGRPGGQQNRPAAGRPRKKKRR